MRFVLPQLVLLGLAVSASLHARDHPDLDYEVIGQGGSMLMVSASGTAVTTTSHA